MWPVAVVVLVVVTGLGFWYLWWVPKTAESCNGLPNGASTPSEAARQFADSLAHSDADAMCRILTDKLTKPERETLMSDLRRDLGNPEVPGQITAQVGEQMGSVLPLTLSGPGGTADVSVWSSYQGWYRVSA